MTRRLSLLLAVPLLLPFPLRAQQPVIPLDSIHVAAASRLRIAGPAGARAVEVVTRADLLRLPVSTLADALARTLGADVLARSPASADLAIRGSSFEQILVLVDGVPMRDDQTGHFHLDVAVPLESIERIEIVRGPGSALYGSSAVGGIVNIVTRRGDPRLRARAGGGSFRTFTAGADAGMAFGESRTTLLAGADITRSDGHRAGTEYDILQLRTAVALPVGAGTLRTDAAWALRDFGAARFYAPFDSREETRSAHATLAWTPAPQAALAFEPRLTWRRHGDDFVLRRDDPAFYRNVHTADQVGGELTLRLHPAAHAHAVFGGEAMVSRLSSTNLGERSERRGALFLEAGTLHRPIQATLGVRADHHSAFGAFLSPSLAVAWDAAAPLRLRASAARGYRAPNWTERFYEDPANIGTADLGPERFIAFEAGAALRFSRAIRADGSLFLRRATDLIDWARPADAAPDAAWRTMNIERATFRGWEIDLHADGPLGSELRAHATGLHLRAAAGDGYASKYALRPLVRVLGTRATFPLPADLSLSADAAHRRRAGGPEWWQVDARAQWRFRGATLHVDAVNIADQRPEDVTGQPAPGRAFHAGLRIGS